MLTVTSKNRLNIKSLMEWTGRVVYSVQYPFILGLLSAFFYVLKQPVPGIVILCIVGSIVLLSFRDLTPFVPVLLFLLMTMCDLTLLNTITPYVFFGLLAISLVAHFFIFPVKKLVFGKLTLPLIILTLAMFMSGVFSNEENHLSISFFLSFCIGPLMLVIYIVYSSYLNTINLKSTKEYFCTILVAVGLVAGIEAASSGVISLIQNNNYYPDAGWGNPNTSATVILLSICANWYLLTKSNDFKFNSITILFLYLLVLLTRSDGCSAIALATLPLFTYFSYKRAELSHRRNLRNLFTTLFYSIAIEAILFIIILLIAKSNGWGISTLFGDSGRTKLYSDALNLFIHSPVFGAGLGYYPPETEIVPLVAYNFHSVFFHSLATMGIFGVSAFIYYYVKRIQILTANNSTFNLIMVIGFICFASYSFIDTCEFNSMPIMMLVTFMFSLIELNNKEGNTFILPSFSK